MLIVPPLKTAAALQFRLDPELKTAEGSVSLRILTVSSARLQSLVPTHRQLILQSIRCDKGLGFQWTAKEGLYAGRSCDQF